MVEDIDLRESALIPGLSHLPIELLVPFELSVGDEQARRNHNRGAEDPGPGLIMRRGSGFTALLTWVEGQRQGPGLPEEPGDQGRDDDELSHRRVG